MDRILIVETDFKLAEKLSMSLTSAEMTALSCGTMEAATALLEKEVYQMIIIDTELKDGNGYDLIYEIGLGIYKSENPVIIAIIPNDRKPENSELVEQGIADYITKPFSTAVLKAKIITQFRRRKRSISYRQPGQSEVIGIDFDTDTDGVDSITIDGYMFDFDAGAYTVAGREVTLNILEQNVLRMLVENKGTVLRREVLTARLKSECRLVTDETALAETIRTLTRKLEADNYIKTVYGTGYMWSVLDDKFKKK